MTVRRQTRRRQTRGDVGKLLSRANAMSSAALESALREGREERVLRGYFGDNYESLRRLAEQARSIPRDAPRVLMLPGLMGSKLVQGRNDLLWLDPWDIVRSRLRRLALDADGTEIRAVDVIASAYLRILMQLRARGFDASFHAYDWRKSLDGLGASLRERIREDARPAHLVGHSMGGLVIRGALWHRDLDASRVPSVVTIGTPHCGSFVPVLALRGVYGVVKKLAWLDMKKNATELVSNVFNTFEGLTQLLPFRGAWDGRDLYDPRAWPKKVPGPRSALLARAPAVQAKLAPADERFRLVVGVGRETVVDLGWNGGDFTYATSLEGDGTVPLALAKLEEAPVWYTRAAHGDQAADDVVSRAVADLLESGRTALLPETHTPSRGPRRELRRSELSRAPYGRREPRDVTAEERRFLLDGLVGAGSETPATLADAQESALAARESVSTRETIVISRRRQRRLEIVIQEGSLTDADARAYLLGIFRGVTPGGAARAVDDALDGAISAYTERRMFSAEIGNVSVLPAGRHGLFAEHVAFVGLGAFDSFTPQVLSTAAEHTMRMLVATKVDDVATVAIGAGTGCTVEESLEHLLRGFTRGMLDAQDGARFRSITFCEMDPSRCAVIRETVVRLARSDLFADIEVALSSAPSRRRIAPAATPAVARSGAPYPAVYLLVREETDPRSPRSRVFTSSVLGVGTKATVVTAQRDVSRRLLDDAIAVVHPDHVGALTLRKLERLGTEVAELVLAKEICDVLATLLDHPLVVVHDEAASRIPWETLRIGTRVPAIEKGLTRQYLARDLSVAKWLEERRMDAELRVLLVVDPTEDLPGAREEGKRLRTLFTSRSHFRVEVLEGAKATKRAIADGFGSGRFDVVHYAGHGFFDPANPGRSGLICAGEEVLRGIDLANAPHLPALVFFNACEVGRVRGRRGAAQRTASAASRAKSSPERTTGVAESLLRGGVAHFVGTYWEVGDAGAKQFAQSFYDDVIRGQPVDEAVLRARRKLAEKDNVDWADYLHYGPRGSSLKRREG